MNFLSQLHFYLIIMTFIMSDDDLLSDDFMIFVFMIYQNVFVFFLMWQGWVSITIVRNAFAFQGCKLVLTTF